MTAGPGDWKLYHRGHLAQDRELDRRIDAVARFALEHSDNDWPLITPPPCGHVRGHVYGSGELRLLTKRRPEGRFDYFAIRR